MSGVHCSGTCIINNSLMDILILYNHNFVCMEDINFILIAMVPIIQILVNYFLVIGSCDFVL